MDSTSVQHAMEAEFDSTELFWRDHYQFLKDHRYTLRRRYEPDWTPSWADGSKDRRECEDSIGPRDESIMDATRRDGTFVVLKRVDSFLETQELVVGRLFSSPELATDSRNHCVPIFDIIEPKPGSASAFIVMPLLFSTNLASYETIGEVVEFFRQIFEVDTIPSFSRRATDMLRRSQGLQFMHQHNVSHGTSKPVNYYLIDFDLSTIYGSEDVRLMTPPWGGDRTVPEHWIPNAPQCDPFAVDVCCIGNVVRQGFLDGRPNLKVKPKQGFEFMRELITDMTDSDPSKRPTMDEVVARYEKISAGLSEWTLRSPVITLGGHFNIFVLIAHWAKQLTYVLWRMPAIPRS
ncbi:hypothetical protein DXG01_004900 [Tephrocybe rancida]|nr:hypothetical protein DXG01_004900 [Tephrocybe rancida]